ncbi:MAG: TadE/TadG family type IV pilus assembly protein [Planctomycetota bacterium]
MIGTRARNHARAERGIVAVELAILLPLLLLLLFGIIEFGTIFFLRNNMFHAAREAARGVSVGELTGEEAEALAIGLLAEFGVEFSVTVTVPDPGNPDDHDVVVLITAPLAAAALGDALGLFDESDVLQASVTMRVE